MLMKDEQTRPLHYGGLIELLWLTIIFLIPLFFNPLGHAALYVHKALLLQFIVVAMLAFFIADLVRGSVGEQSRQFRNLIASPLYLSVLVFGLVTIVATVASVTPAISFWGSYFRKEGLLTILCWILFFLLMTMYMRSRQQVLRAVYTLLISSGIVSVFGVVQHYFPAVSDALHFVYSSRVFSTTGNALSLSTFLTMVLPLNLALMVWLWSKRKEGKDWQKLTGLTILLVLQVWCLLLAQYSVVILLYIVSVLVFLLLLGIIKKQRIITTFGAVLLLALAVLAVLILLPSAFPNVGYELPGTVSLPSDVSAESLGLKTLGYRVQYWRSSLDTVFKPPEIPFFDDKLHALRTFIGYGPETFVVTFQQVFPKNLVDHSILFMPLTRPHNHYLYLATTVGLLGLASFLAILATFFYLCVRFLRWAVAGVEKLLLAAFIAGVAGYTVDMLFNPSTISAALVFWVMLSLVLVIGKLIVNDRRGEYKAGEINQVAEIGTARFRRVRAYMSVVCAVILIAIGGLITFKPLLADMYLQKGLKYYYSPYGTETYVALSKAAELAPGEAVYQSYLGEYGYYLARRVADERTKETFLKFSTSSYEKALQLEPYVSYRYHTMADVYTHWAGTGADDKWPIALSLYDKAWQLSPRDPLILDKWALALVVKGELHDAREKLELAEAADPSWFGNALISALIAVEENKDEEALPAFVASIRGNLYDFANYFDKFCFDLADYNMVAPLDKSLDAYVQKTPEDWIPRAMLGVTSLFVGNLEKSVGEFRAATLLAEGADVGHLTKLIRRLSQLSPELKERLPDIITQ